ncbi:MAG: hypothetical protein HXX18_06335 [Bacteroidetes bacterium]|nr:hypothetical protein [Bacteroidota bacterium]
MAYKLGYTSIVFSNLISASKFSGSSKYKVFDDELKEQINKNKKSKIESKEVKINNNTEAFSCDLIEKNEVTKANKTYKLNKSKVKAKCNAFSRLQKSIGFMAFYSISFPEGIKDITAYKIFNTWLTRCRLSKLLNSYLWVAERQKNNTIHFHLLTNDKMPIRKVNGFMATSLKNEQKKGCQELININTEKYNGVDVKKVGRDKKGLISYLAKYISKNDIEFFRLPWHCSRDVSRLFTSINFNKNEEDKYFNLLPTAIDNYKIFKTEFYRVGAFKFQPQNIIYTDLDKINETIYKPIKTNDYDKI